MKTKKIIKTLSMFAFAVLTATTANMIATAVFAADNTLAVSIATWVIRVIGAVPFVPAIINGIQGLTDMQEAKAEGAGPAADKAKQKLIAAVTMALVAVVIIAAAEPLARAAVKQFTSQTAFDPDVPLNTPTPIPTKSPQQIKTSPTPKL